MINNRTPRPLTIRNEAAFAVAERIMKSRGHEWDPVERIEHVFAPETVVELVGLDWDLDPRCSGFHVYPGAVHPTTYLIAGVVSVSVEATRDGQTVLFTTSIPWNAELDEAAFPDVFLAAVPFGHVQHGETVHTFDHGSGPVLRRTVRTVTFDGPNGETTVDRAQIQHAHP